MTKRKITFTAIVLITLLLLLLLSLQAVAVPSLQNDPTPSPTPTAKMSECSSDEVPNGILQEAPNELLKPVDCWDYKSYYPFFPYTPTN